MFFSKMGHRHCNHAAEKDARVYPSRDVATQFAKFESGGLQHLGYIQERVYHSQIHHVKELNCWKNVCRGSGGCWMTPSSRQRLHKKISSTFFIWTQCISQYISIVVWMHVFVWMVGTLNPKCDRYKHVQSANISVKCVTSVSETFTRYGSNIMCGRKLLC